MTSFKEDQRERKKSVDRKKKIKDDKSKVDSQHSPSNRSGTQVQRVENKIQKWRTELVPHDGLSKLLELGLRQGLSESVSNHFISRNKRDSDDASFIELSGIVVG